MKQLKRINFQTIQAAHTPQHQKNKQFNQNVAKRPKQTFLQRRHTDGQEAHEKMLNIANYWRNANQNYKETSPHTRQNGHHQKNLQTKCWRRCGEKGTVLPCWW